MSSTAEIWNKMLDTVGFNADQKSEIITAIPTARLLVGATEKVLQNSNIPPIYIAEIMGMRAWYLEWVQNGREGSENFDEVFTIEKYEDFNVLRQLALEEKAEDRAAAGRDDESKFSLSSERKKSDTYSLKIESKDVPKLPKGQVTLKGKVFDDWCIAFKVKMEHAGIGDLLEANFNPPDELEEDDVVEEFERKEKYLKSHLTNATLGTNAYDFIDNKRQSGLEMWKELLTIFQGDDHEADDAVTAAALLEGMSFTKHTRMAPEAFLSKFCGYLKRMETVDEKGTVIPAMNKALIPNIFRSKIKHPAFTQWSGLSQKSKDDWDTMKTSFLREAEQMKSEFRKSGDTTDRFRTHNQQMTAPQIQSAIDKGGYLPGPVFRKLTKEQKTLLFKNKEKRKNDKKNGNNQGTLPSQYAANLGQLEPGTIIIPPSAQQTADTDTSATATTNNVKGKTNNAMQSHGQTEAGTQIPTSNNLEDPVVMQ